MMCHHVFMTGPDLSIPDQQETCPLCSDQMSAAFVEEIMGAMSELSVPLSAKKFYALLARDMISDVPTAKHGTD